MFSKISSINFFLGKAGTRDLQQITRVFRRFPGNFRLVATRYPPFSKGLFDWSKELPRLIKMFVIKSLEKSCRDSLLQYGEEWGIFALYRVVFYSSSKGIHHRKLRRDCCVWIFSFNMWRQKFGVGLKNVAQIDGSRRTSPVCNQLYAGACLDSI